VWCLATCWVKPQQLFTQINIESEKFGENVAEFGSISANLIFFVVISVLHLKYFLSYCSCFNTLKENLIPDIITPFLFTEKLPLYMSKHVVLFPSDHLFP